MSRRLAHRPRHHFARITPRPLRSSHQDYLRQRWTYRQQRAVYARRQPGYSLALVPCFQYPRTDRRKNVIGAAPYGGSVSLIS